MTIAEQLEKIGEERGLKIGEQRGLKLGEERGLKLGEERGLKLGEERGLKLGEERGLKLGKQRLRAVALRLLSKKMSLEDVAEISGLSIEEVRQLRTGNR